jgi:Ca2+-binding RTX toxin-like protein
MADDIYYVFSKDDRVVESAGGGYDTIVTPVSYALMDGSEIERLSAAPGSFSLMLTGNAFANWLVGTDGNDTLDGGLGADVLEGGLGDDTYIVSDRGYTIIEGTAAGHDIVRTSVSFSLQNLPGVEEISANGRASINLTGNTLDNVIYGNVGKNTLKGLGGNDTVYGDGGNDKIYGGSGNDKLFGGRGNDKVYGEAGNDALYGDVGHDSLSGGTGNDRLYGGTGHDTIRGGNGNDRLYGDTGNDNLYGDNGNDLIYTGAGSNIASGGNGTDKIYGSYGNDRLNGDGGNDRIFGDAGDDVIAGGLGNDRLSGGYDSDTFVFDTPLDPRTNLDTITDFDVSMDTIALAGSFFGGIGGAGTVPAFTFHVGSGATSVTDRIIYDRDQGTLYYDADGTGGFAQIAFAKVGAIDLSYANFKII